MDTYEHAYAIDYGANASGYIDTFFQNINWDELNIAQRRRSAPHGNFPITAQLIAVRGLFVSSDFSGVVVLSSRRIYPC
jgi:iron/manganese superoxide dismutase-like protein